jgi:membrane-associated phospholipid phosphatase
MNIGIKDVLYQIRLFFIPYLAVLCVCLAIKLNFSREAIYFAVNSRNFPLADTLAPYFTDMGNGVTVIVLSAILLLYNYRAAFLMFTSWAVTSILAQIVKFIFDAPRPKLYFKDQLNRIHFVKGVDMLSLHSFPSGHTTTAFSAALVILYLTKNKKWAPMLLLLAILIGYSRMYLSEHFFEDVVAGSVIGVIGTVFWLGFIDSRAFLHADKWSSGLLKK